MEHKFNKTVIAIHAHPDDTEAFCAGTLYYMKKAGYRIVIATMTPGGLGGINSTEAQTSEQREKEARAAADELGAEYHCFGGRDGYLFDNEEIRIQTTAFIRKHKAGIIFTHLPFDYHIDHRTTANIVETAAMVSSLPNVPCEEEPLEITPLLYHTAPLGFTDTLGETIVKPHFYVDISDGIETKMNMLAQHKSQIELMSVMHKMNNFFDEMKKYNKMLGEIVGVDYAEVFWQHLGGGFQKDKQLQHDIKEHILFDKE